MLHPARTARAAGERSWPAAKARGGRRAVFSAPDETTGLVTVSAPAGSFPPGTTILIVNSGNGVVLSLTADNAGAVSGELPASVDDRLLVTVTDPLGNAVTFERSQYVIDPTTGETAVGAGGGVVTSPEARKAGNGSLKSGRKPLAE